MSHLLKNKKKKKVVSVTLNEQRKENHPATGPPVVNKKQVVQTVTKIQPENTRLFVK